MEIVIVHQFLWFNFRCKTKKNIVDAKSQWDDIKNLRIRNFNFKANPSQKMLGLVAQEVETICPNLVKVRSKFNK